MGGHTCLFGGILTIQRSVRHSSFSLSFSFKVPWQDWQELQNQKSCTDRYQGTEAFVQQLLTDCLCLAVQLVRSLDKNPQLLARSLLQAVPVQESSSSTTPSEAIVPNLKQATDPG